MYDALCIYNNAVYIILLSVYDKKDCESCIIIAQKYNMKGGDTMNIGNRIKEKRKSIGMSVDELADKPGKNRATIYRYENNDIKNVPITVLEPLSKILKTSLTELLRDDQAI